MAPATSFQSCSLGTFLVPCSASDARRASSSRSAGLDRERTGIGAHGPHPERPSRGLHEVDTAAVKRVRKVVADDTCRAAGPEQHSRQGAHTCTDGDVLDADLPHLPADRHDDVVQDADHAP